MESRKEILINVYFDKSVEAFESAEILLNNNKHKSASNRIYYAVFYTVCALAEKHDYITAKHTQMMGWFNKKFIYEDKIFDIELSKIYRDTFNYRQESDYNKAYNSTMEKATELFHRAKYFIETVRTKI